MRFRSHTVPAIALIALAGCQAGGTATLESDDQISSYSIGLEIGTSLRTTGDHLDMPALLKGLDDALEERDPALPPEELQAARQRVAQLIQEEQVTERASTSEKNQAEGEAYLAENATREGVTTTASGLQYEVLREGDGAKPTPTNQVRIHYKGTLLDGTEFDSSYGRGTPATFGVTGVIPGFSEGLQLMSIGSQYRLVIPADLAYGSGGQGSIGPYATLIFEIELLEIL